MHYYFLSYFHGSKAVYLYHEPKFQFGCKDLYLGVQHQKYNASSIPQELLRSQEQQMLVEERLSNSEEHNKSERMHLQVRKITTPPNPSFGIYSSM